MRALKAGVLTLGVLLAGSVAGLFALLLWVLASTGGARWALDMVAELGLAEVQAERVEGQLIGPLELHGLVYRGAGVEVRLDRARLEWSPARLLRRDVQVDLLQAGRLDIRLGPRPAEDEEPDSGPPRVPKLPVGIVLERLRLDRLRIWLPQADEAQTVEAIAADAVRWRGARLQAERLAARHALTGTVQASLDAALETDAVDLQTLDLREVPDQPGEATPLRLSARGPLRLDPLHAELQLEWQALRWPLTAPPQVISPRGQLRVGGGPRDLEVRGGVGLGERGEIELEGRYTPERMQAELRWQQLQWPLLGQAQVRSARGAFQVQGRPADYRYSLDARLAAEGQDGHAQARGSGSLTHVVLDTLRLAVDQARVEGKARVDWQVGTAGGVAVDADLDVRELNPALVAADWPGRLNGRLKASTQIENQVPSAQFEVWLRDSELRGYPLSLEARGHSQGTTVNLASLQLRSAGTTLNARGQVTPPLDLQATLDSPDLVALWPGLGGSARLEAKVRGPLDAPHAVVGGQVRELVYDTLQLARADLDADIALAGAWQLNLDVRDLSGPMRMDRAQVTLDGDAGAHRLVVSVDAEPAQAELAWSGALDPDTMRWRGLLASGRVEPEGLSAWALEEPAALVLDARSVDLDPACWAAPDSRACLRLLRDGERLRAAFRLEQLDLAYFAPFLPDGLSLAGSTDGGGVMALDDGRLTEARARLSSAPITVRRDGQTLLDTGAGELRLTEVDGLATLALNLPVESGHLHLDGRLGEAGRAGVPLDRRALAARLELDLPDLAWLRLASEEVDRVQGRIAGRVDWAGSLAAPDSQGELNLFDGQLDLSTPGLRIRELGLRLTAHGQALQLEGRARSGEGLLELDGEADLGGDGPQLGLRIRGQDFQAADMSLARAWISPDLRLRYADRKLDVSGEIKVPRAEITPVKIEGGVGPSADQVIVSDTPAPADDTPGLQVTADVLLTLGEAVSLDGYGLSTRLEGSVRAIEQPGRSGTGRGEVRLVGGRYEAYGQELDIKTGRLLFTGGPLTEPALEVRAVRQPREDIEVGVLVRGTLDQPQFELFSTPPMPRERQLSWLVLGRSLDEGSGAGERAMLANAALSLGLGGTDRLAQGLRSGLGLDEISIGSQPGEDAQQASLTVGKYLSPKLYVSYGVGLFQPGQIFRLLYELGGGFKVATESGVHTGGDLLYSVERP